MPVNAKYNDSINTWTFSVTFIAGGIKLALQSGQNIVD